MGVGGSGGGCCCNCSRVRAVGGFLFLPLLLAQEASLRLVDGPRHVVLTPMKGIVPMFLFLGFSFFGRHSLSRLILLLSFLVGSCCKPPRYVPYKGTYVPYVGTFGAPDQGQMLDV
jgi:hypothetical protein